MYDARQTLFGSFRSLNLSIVFPGGVALLNLHARGVDFCDFTGSGGPEGDNLHAELAQAHTEHLEKSRLSGIQDLALLADSVLFTLTTLVTEDDLALDHAGRDAESSQLGLESVLQRNVVLGGDFASGGINDTGGDAECSGGSDACAGKVDKRQRREVVEDFLGGAVGQNEANVAGQVFRKTFGAFSDGFFGGLTEGLGHELCLAKEQSAVGKFATDILQVVVTHVVDAENEAVLVLGNGIADVLEELVLLLTSLLGDLGEVVDLCAP